MKKRFNIILIIVTVLLTSIYFVNLNRNITIYLSSQREDTQYDNVSLYIDDKLIDKIDLNKYYDLKLYSNEFKLSLGNHVIKLKTDNDEVVLKQQFTYYGIKNFIVIGYFDENNYSFQRLYRKPKLL